MTGNYGFFLKMIALSVVSLFSQIKQNATVLYEKSLLSNKQKALKQNKERVKIIKIYIKEGLCADLPFLCHFAANKQMLKKKKEKKGGGTIGSYYLLAFFCLCHPSPFFSKDGESLRRNNSQGCWRVNLAFVCQKKMKEFAKGHNFLRSFLFALGFFFP